MWFGPRLVAALLCGLVLGQTDAAETEDGLRHDVGCRKRRIVHTIKSANCVPRRLLSYACQGRCTSYTQISKTLEFKRHCKCCQEMGERTARVRVRCRDPRTHAFKVYTMLIKVPGDCMCRPCSQGVRVVPLEMTGVKAKRTL